MTWLHPPEAHVCARLCAGVETMLVALEHDRIASRDFLLRVLRTAHAEVYRPGAGTPEPQPAEEIAAAVAELFNPPQAPG